ncbi:hypothetical protein FisN_7Lh346 [Fistulifera solaris]|uniref:TFIIS central domain-containing protein n=1 Tax=Fistulifera solaris TaxID=1519565 RepID=A0A1Z5JS69_FISSO|nr:hypothetical protein FisN_7Lh346 [Fistulifera solaris]|eukprot:GAX16611.1 hypothetical protein FisN_7Lh346 [Fistulifera solaris]
MTSMNEGRLSTKNETPVDPWVEMLMGRQWEIYWELNSDYEDDWYDARIEAFLRQTPEGTFLFRVSFVGDDQTCEMLLSPNIVRPRNGVTDLSPATIEWAQGLVGTDVEIDWRKDAEEGKATVPDNDESDEKGWYVANILAFDQERRLFKVKFEGEIYLYDMHLKPELVRPSAVAWVKRSLALLQLETESFHEWIQALPPDTSMLEDSTKIVELEQAKQMINAAEESTWIRQWIGLIQAQLYLRTRLAPIEREKRRRTVDGIPAPTETYVDYLVQCLKQHKDCAAWYFECEQLIEAANQATTKTKWSSDLVFDVVLKRGCDCLELLKTVDASVSGSKRRSRSSPNERRAKRRRKAIKDFWTPAGQLHEEFDVQDLISFSTFQRFTDQTTVIDRRWYVATFVGMLKMGYTSLIAPLREWKWRVEYALGERDDPYEQVTASDGESTDQEDVELVNEKATVFVSYDDVHALMDQAKVDTVLSKFDLDVAQLSSRMKLILEFEKRGTLFVSSVFDEPVTVLDKDQDTICLQLRQLQKESSEPELMHIHPLGSVTSSLSRLVIRDALLCREWFLDLCHAETQRERVAFIENIVSRWSYLPPINLKEIEVRSDEIFQRLKMLSARCTDRSMLFDKISTMLNDRSEEARRDGLLCESEVEKACKEFTGAAVLSLAEEKLALRSDLLRWEQKAKLFMKTDRPFFTDLESLFQELEALFLGNSVSRTALTEGLRQNVLVENEIRAFVKCDDEAISGTLSARLRSLYQKSSNWKERTENIISALLGFGNESLAGCHVQPKHGSMIDIRRIADLLDEYEDLQIDITPCNDLLRRVHDDALKWCDSVASSVKDPCRSFEACLQAAHFLGSNRPKGIIVDPTKPIYELIIDLLQWYIAVKALVTSPNASRDAVASVLLQGIEVVRFYGDNKYTESISKITPDTANFIMKQVSASRPARLLSLNKIENSELLCHLLNRMVDDCQDDQERHPFLSLLYWLWLLRVEDFIKDANGVAKGGNEATLARAKSLLAEQPIPATHIHEVSIVHKAVDVVEQLRQLITTAENVVKTTEECLNVSRNLFRIASSNESAVRYHYQELKEMLTKLKFRYKEGSGIVLERSLETQVELMSKVFSWLTRTFSYPILHSHDPSLWQGEHVKNDPRIPWDALVSLANQSPNIGEEQGDLACIKLRVKELHDEALKWQEEISSLTMLSLRGGKRRSPGSLEDTKASCIIDMSKVEELCKHSILHKVSFPREESIRDMLHRSKEFERALFDFLGKDYDGADRSALPEGGSLVAADGSFLPLRLTGSPMYQDMISAIGKISHIAENVFAHTPGKAAFDWICSAVSWIESLNKALVISEQDLEGESAKNITISRDAAIQLLREGEDVFVDVPEDLRRTLSEHKIYISSAKEGTMTVKSRKGGAHHALGVVAVRWCPLLFESLKSDVNTLNEWELVLMTIALTYNCIRPALTDNSDQIQRPEDICWIMDMREALTDLFHGLKDLVIMPSSKDIESVNSLLIDLEMRVIPHLNERLITSHLNWKYEEGPLVIKSRFDHLDALVTRQRVCKERSTDSLNGKGSHDSGGRVAARRLLFAALRKSMAGLKIPDDDETLHHCCSVAWEIENAACDAFLESVSSDTINSQYKEKIKTVKRSLEDPRNKILQARVLTGDIAPEKLVTMSVEELANPVTQKQRAAAESKQNNVLVAPPTATRKTSLEPEVPNSSRNSTSSSSTENTTLANKPAEKTHVSIETHRTLPPPKISAFRDLARAVEAATRKPPPPPPASLVPNLVAPVEPQSHTVTNNTNGSNIFRLSVGGSYHFTAEFHAEGRMDPYVCHFIPELLVETRRSPWKVLDQFLREKLRSGKYEIVSLRLLPCSDKDARVLDSFARDYEHRDRVSTCQVQNEKLYLITPRFQSLLRDVVHFKIIPGTYVLWIRLL